jgi:hypothetical protein
LKTGHRPEIIVRRAKKAQKRGIIMANELQKYDGYYDRKSAWNTDYRQFMEKQAMVKDLSIAIQRSADKQLIGNAVIGANITSHIDQSAERLQYSMVRMQTGIQTAIHAQTFAVIASQAALARTFQQGFDKVNNTLDMGFSGISSQLGSMTAAFSIGLDRVADNLKQMSKDICDRLDAIHDIVNNPLLTQSRELYRRAIVNYNKGFFEEALEDIKTAVEKNKTDYISWFLMGKVYLFGASEFSSVISLDPSIEALTTAAKYISPDIAVSEEAKRMAAEIWFYIGLAKYNKSNDLKFHKQEAEAATALEGALQAFEKSYGYSGAMLEARYNTARCKTLMGNKTGAIEDLEAVIAGDRGYCLKAAADGDFEDIDIFALIERLKKEMYPKAKAILEALRAKLADTVFLGGTFADRVKKLVDEWVPETFGEDLPYFDIRDGYEMFPVILEYLNIEEYPCDRLVAQLEPKDCPYDDSYKKKNEHPFSALNISSSGIYSKLYDNSLVVWLAHTWEGDEWNLKTTGAENIHALKEKLGITASGYPRLLTYRYDSIAQPGKIEFLLPTEEVFRRVKCAPCNELVRSFDPNQYYSHAYHYHYSRFYEQAPNTSLIDITKSPYGVHKHAGFVTNEYNPLWPFALFFDKSKSLNEQAFGFFYAKDESIFIPLAEIDVFLQGGDAGGKFRIHFYHPVAIFLNKETLIVCPSDSKKNMSDPIKVYQPGIMSKSKLAEIEQKARQEAEEARRKAEAAETAKREAEAAKRKEEEQRQRWVAQGLCRYCGGTVGGLFTKKCKVCGRIQ